MGTFAETAIFGYCLSFAGQGKQTSVFRFLLQETNRSFAVFCCLFAANKGKLLFWTPRARIFPRSAL
jgi:predicted DNA-binding helix-hairpin-helix protein